LHQIVYHVRIIAGMTGLLFILLCMEACQFVGKEKEPGLTASKAISSDSLKVAIISFDETEHNFGRVYEGEQVGWFFSFRNTGTKDLLITNAYASCGCTVPGYNTEPVHPGDSGEIKVVFDSKDRSGIQTKTITVESNAQNLKITLKVTAEIINK
jgi:hypothetical protein